MENPSHDQVNARIELPNLVFREVVHTLGATAIEQLYERYQSEAEKGHLGVAARDKEEFTKVAVTADGYSFKFYDWGPYKLGHQEVKGILANIAEQNVIARSFHRKELGEIYTQLSQDIVNSEQELNSIKKVAGNRLSDTDPNYHFKLGQIDGKKRFANKIYERILESATDVQELFSPKDDV